MLGWLIGGACVRRGEAGCMGVLDVEVDGGCGRSVFSFGFVVLSAEQDVRDAMGNVERSITHPACFLRRAMSLSAKSVGWGAWRSLPFLDGPANSGVVGSGMLVDVLREVER
jgi:hypothetical protein